MEERPNLLLITTDQQRHDAVGYANAQGLRTANLDGLAGAGMRFRRAYVTCPVCIPARRTLLSGQHPKTHGLRWYQDGLEFDPPDTMPGCLSRAGYQTQLVGKMHLHPQGKRYGFDNIILSECAHHRPHSEVQRRNDYVDWLRANGIQTHPNLHGLSGNGRLARPAQLPEAYHHSTWVAQQAADFLVHRRDPSVPWFLHLSFVAPHPPLNPPYPYWERYADKDLRPAIGEWAPRWQEGMLSPQPDAAHGPFDPEEMRLAIAGYYGLIHHIDDLVAYVLDRYLEYHTPRPREPLYILFSSDHGEMLGDHSLYRKSLPYEASAHVPFFVTGRNVPLASGESDLLATWEDIMPTLLDLAGVPIPAGLDGMSLAPAVRGETQEGRPFVYGECAGVADNHYIVEGDWKYIWFARTNEEQLFNLKEDPAECRDLSGDAGPLEAMRDRMAGAVEGLPDRTYDRLKLNPCRNQPPKALWK